MTYPALQVNQLNLPALYQAGQQIEGQRMQNRLAQMQMAEAERKQKQQAQVSKLMPQAMQRDQNALNQVTALDPDMGFKLIDQFSKMDEAQRDQVAFNTDMVGRAAMWADTPEKWAQAIDYLARQGLPGLEEYRGQFSPEARQMAIQQSQTVKDALAQSFQREKFGAEQEWKGREFAADQAHRGAQLGIQRGQLSVSQQRLAADQAHRERQAAAAFAARQERMGLENEKLEIARTRAEKGPMSVNVAVGAGEKAWNTSRAQGIESTIGELVDSAKESRSMVDNMTRMQKLLETNQTGPWEARKQKIQQGLQSLGVDPSIVGNIETATEFDAIAKRLVLEEQQRQSGPQTEGDRLYIQQSTASGENPTQVNKNLLNWGKSRLEIDNILAKQANKIRTLTSLEDAGEEFNRIMDMKMTLPAATVIQDTPVTFSEFADAMKKNGYSREQALAEWAKRTSDAPENP